MRSDPIPQDETHSPFLPFQGMFVPSKRSLSLCRCRTLSRSTLVELHILDKSVFSALHLCKKQPLSLSLHNMIDITNVLQERGLTE